MLIRGGTVWTPTGPQRADVRTDGGRIAEVGTLAPRADEDVIDAAGLHVLPGMADVHVHADDRIGIRDLADTFETASRLAIRTGVTTIAGFVTQRPGETLVQAVERVLARADGRTFCDVAFHLTPTAWPWDWPEVERLVAAGFSTFKLYTTYREAGLYTDYARLAEVMGRLAALGARLLVHCEDDADPRRASRGPRTSPTRAPTRRCGRSAPRWSRWSAFSSWRSAPGVPFTSSTSRAPGGSRGSRRRAAASR